ALVTFAIVPVLFAVAGYFRLRARDAYREVRRRLARLNAFLQESIQGMAVVQLFAREAHERARFRERNEDYRRSLVESTRFAAATGRVVFEDVWFAYADERWVLSDCSFTVAPGEHVALVGTTGEGKSTCVRLLNRTWDVGRGRVLVDGVDVRAWELAALRRHVGVIFQDPVLFTGSVE